MARYELVEGTSSKFWEAELEGKKLTLRWGRIGTGGQSKTKTFSSPALAAKEHGSLIAEKTKKGYRESKKAAASKTAKPAAAKPARAKSVKEPTDVDGWLVYADELLAGGEPSAELIVMEERLAKSGDAALRKKRDALFKKHAATTKGVIARGVIAAGGGTLGDASVSGRIQDLLLEKYSLAHLAVFARQAGSGKMDLAAAAKKLSVELPPSFTAFHRWARTIASRFPAVSGITIPDDGAYGLASLDEVVKSTEMWRSIQKQQPNREWRPGFVHVASWDSAYEMVMDTRSDITKPAHQLFSWDFKGGSGYSLKYKTFDAYLEDALKLLKGRAYFEKTETSDDDDDSDDDDLFQIWSDTFHARRGGYFEFAV